MLCREIIALCSQIHTKHINTLCGQNVELLNVKLAVHIVTSVREYSSQLRSNNKHYYNFPLFFTETKIFLNSLFKGSCCMHVYQIYILLSPSSDIRTCG